MLGRICRSSYPFFMCSRGSSTPFYYGKGWHYTFLQRPKINPAWVHWTRKLAAELSESKSRRLFTVGSVAADSLLSQNFRHWSAAASSDRLIGSGKPGHDPLGGLGLRGCKALPLIGIGSQDTLNRAIDQLPKRLTMVVKEKVVMLNFVWTNHMCYRSSLFYSMPNENWAKLVRHCQI